MPRMSSASRCVGSAGSGSADSTVSVEYSVSVEYAGCAGCAGCAGTGAARCGQREAPGRERGQIHEEPIVRARAAWEARGARAVQATRASPRRVRGTARGSEAG
eukprot:7188722-Prymnesium_polylepis.1